MSSTSKRLLPIALLLLAGCPGPEPTAQPFFADGFEQSFIEVRDCRFSIEHDGNSIVVYANPESSDAYLDGVYPFADGTVLVKSEFADSECTDLVRYSAMKKEAGGWQWQRVDADREVIEADLPERCIRCHAGCTNGRDLACTDP